MIPVYLDGFGVFDLTPEQAERYRHGQERQRSAAAELHKCMQAQRREDRVFLLVVQASLWAALAVAVWSYV